MYAFSLLYIIVPCTLRVFTLIYTVKSVCFPGVASQPSQILISCFNFCVCVFKLLSQVKFSPHLTFALD